MGRFFGVALVAALVSAAVCLGLHYWGALPAQSAEVPTIDGLGPEQARELVGARDLLLVLDGELPDPARAGSLVKQRPLAGSQVPRGSAVHAFLAAPMPTQVAAAALVPALVPVPAPGSAPVPVPVPVPAAPVPVPAPVPAAPVPGTPAVAAPAAAPAPVAPAPAHGRAATVPSLIGKRLAQARELIQRAGYVVGDLRYGNDSDVGPERVLRQQPPAGTPAPPGTRIDLVVNEAE